MSAWERIRLWKSKMIPKPGHGLVESELAYLRLLRVAWILACVTEPWE
jgi:hypothetical protein